MWPVLPHSLITILSNFGWYDATTCMLTVHVALHSLSFCSVFMEPPVGCRPHILLFPTALEEARAPSANILGISRELDGADFHTRSLRCSFSTFLPRSFHRCALPLPGSKEVVSHPALFLDCVTHTLSKYTMATIWVSSLLNRVCAITPHILYMRLLQVCIWPDDYYYFKLWQPSFLMDCLHLIQWKTMNISLYLHLFHFSSSENLNQHLSRTLVLQGTSLPTHIKYSCTWWATCSNEVLKARTRGE